MIYGTSDRKIAIYDCRNLNNSKYQAYSPLKYQTRSLCFLGDDSSFAVGSVAAELSAQYLSDPSKSFTSSDPSSNGKNGFINALSYNRNNNILASAGSNMTVSFWNLNEKKKIQSLQKLPNTISCASFSDDGYLFCYVASYDWHIEIPNKPNTTKYTNIYFYPFDSNNNQSQQQPTSFSNPFQQQNTNQNPFQQQQQPSSPFNNQNPFQQQQQPSSPFDNQNPFQQQQQPSSPFNNQNPFQQQQQPSSPFDNQNPFQQQQPSSPFNNLFQNGGGLFMN